MTFFFDTDLHSHIIPCVDDGSQNMEQSLDILKRLHGNGIKRVFCTPHINPELFSLSQGQLVDSFNILTEQVKEEGIDIEMKLSGEYMVHETFLEQDFSDTTKFLTFDGTHILIEMSYMFESRNIKDTIYELNLAGFTPIIAHPERYTFYYDDMKKIKQLCSMDCELQLNYISLSGRYGKHSLNVIKYLLENNLYTYIGSDSHSEGQIRHMEEMKLKNKQIDKLMFLAENNKKLWQ